MGTSRESGGDLQRVVAGEESEREKGDAGKDEIFGRRGHFSYLRFDSSRKMKTGRIRSGSGLQILGGRCSTPIYLFLFEIYFSISFNYKTKRGKLTCCF